MVERQVTSEKIYTGRVVSLKVDTVETQAGRLTTREVVVRPDTVSVLAIDDESNVLLVSQHRYVLGADTLEIPAGTIDPGETPEQAALRELREETGYGCDSLVLLHTYMPAIGYCTESMSIYLARGLSPEPLKGDEERISTVRMPFGEAYDAVLSGNSVFKDAKTTIALLLAKARHLV